MLLDKMSEVKTTVSFPSSFPLSVKVSESDMPDFIKRTLAIELYREGKLSLGKAAELAGARNKWEMLTILDSIAVFHSTILPKMLKMI